jgi:hypothetical protein
MSSRVQRMRNVDGVTKNKKASISEGLLGCAPPALQLSNQFLVDLKGLYDLKALLPENAWDLAGECMPFPQRSKIK